MHSLAPIFAPKSVAVVGASRSRDSIGWAIVHNLISAQFTGAIFPVNPKADAVHSLKCYPSLSAIPDPIDLVIVTVPRALVPGVVDEALAKQVRGLVIITAGYGETGTEGRALELELRDRVRAAGIRMIGPNCMGVINTDPAFSLDATFSPTHARPGSIGFVSQSGALGVAILNVAAELGIGLTQFVSMGNKADVSGNDLLEYWEDDPETKVICMYLESFGNPRRFTEIAKRVTKKKPILIVKSGRTAEGARAASSHTGALAGADVTVSAFLEQCGVLRANTIEELFDMARALDRCPLPAGDRVGIVTNAGGPAIMATDACVNVGLRLAEFSPATRTALETFLPTAASLANPVDMIASATPEHYGKTLAAVLADPEVDAALVINVKPLISNPRDVLEEVGRVAKASPKPVLAVMMAEESFYEGLKAAHHLPPVYRFPESAARALAQLTRYGQWRRRPTEEPAPRFAFDDAAIGELLSRPGPDGYLTPGDSFRLLEHLGVPVAPWRVVADAEGANGAVAAAEAIGYPVVLKGIAPGLVHKSEAKAIELDLASADEVRAAATGIGERFAAAGLALSGFLVQAMAGSGHETIFGISTDPRYGPVLMFGMGGKYVEVFRDVRFAVTPLTRGEAHDLVRGIQGVKLLQGVRGDRPVDFELLEEVALRLACLVQRFPAIAELDINPFLAAPVGESRAVDVRVRVSEG